MNSGDQRPDLNLYFMRMARLVATRSTCLRRAVGCVLVDVRGHVLSTGYNGVAAGEEHCNESQLVGDNYKNVGNGVSIPGNMKQIFPHACAGAFAKPGTQLSECAAVHAEQNALLQCKDPWSISTAYVTVAPCDSCLKLFLNTSCQVLVIADWYRTATGESNEFAVQQRWNGGNRAVLLEPRL